MTSTRMLLAAVGALAAVALAAPAAAKANEVTKWNQIAASTLAAFSGPAGGAPPALQIHMAMTQGAVYDAVNAIERRHRPYLLGDLFDSMASKDAAVATAAYTVLYDIASTVPDRPDLPFHNRASRLADLDAKYAEALALIPDSAFKTEGIAAGEAAAEAMIAARQNDGRFGPSPWVSNPLPGHWQPLLPDGTAPLDPTLGGAALPGALGPVRVVGLDHDDLRHHRLPSRRGLRNSGTGT